MDPRPLPHNPHAELCAVSMAFHHRNAESEMTARGFIAEWLYLPKFRTFWKILSDYRAKHPAICAITPVELLSTLSEGRDSGLDEIGGPAGISEAFLNSVIFTAERLDALTDILRRDYQRRRAIKLAADLTHSAYEGDGFDEALSASVTDLGAITTGTQGANLINGADALRELVADITAEVETGKPLEPPALSSGIREIDELVGGLVPYFWLVGADTSGGKTALSLQLVRSVLNQDGRALVFALEMRAKQLVRRLVAAEGRIPIQRLLRPHTLNQEDMVKLGGPGSDWRAERLVICDDPDVTIQEVRAIARSEHARDPLSVVLVDYIQLASAGKFRDGANREQEISFIGAQCVKMAKELGCPVIAPTQLTDDGKVRESRALKHHAAVYLVIEEDRIICAKNRDGQRDWMMPYKLTGDIQTFEPHTR